mgnify:CR=1 FL=1
MCESCKIPPGQSIFLTNIFASEGSILIQHASGIGFSGCRTKIEEIAGLAHIPSKGLKRVSWNAAHIAVRFMRVCVEIDFVFWIVTARGLYFRGHDLNLGNDEFWHR